MKASALKTINKLYIFEQRGIEVGKLKDGVREKDLANPLSSLLASKAQTKNNSRCVGPVADLEKHLPSEWWKNLFNSLYLKTDADVVENDENSVREVDTIIAATGVKPSDTILDLCCGQGRHIIEFAKRGYKNLVGIDRSRYLVRLAKKRAKQQNISERCRFSEGDARKFKFDSCSVDVVTVLGNSFGYFETEEDDLQVLKEMNRVLKSEGSVYLDLTDGEWMREHFQRRSWEWIDQNLLVCRERHLSDDRKRLICREVVIEVNKGAIADQFYAERLYSFDELRKMLEKAGFEQVELLNNVQSLSSRNQDLGMMAHRMEIKGQAPKKYANFQIPVKNKISCTVIMGDPNLPDKVKKDGIFNLEDMETINALKKALKSLIDFKFSYIDNHATLIKDLVTQPPAFVFNLCDEGFYNEATQELHIPSLLEMLKVPYTGAGPECLAACYDKSLTRALAQTMDVPVPDEIWIDPANSSAAIPNEFPAFLKPAFGDSSLGITKNALVKNADELMSYYGFLKKNFPSIPILVQEYLSGTEYSVAIIGNGSNLEFLPVLEVDFSHLPKDLPQILSYESKWEPESPYWNHIHYKEAVLSDEELQQLMDHSVKLFERMKCRDYARFDFRRDANGVCKLLEVNPNPGWCWDGKLNKMANMIGLDYSKLLHKILITALERMQLISQN